MASSLQNRPNIARLRRQLEVSEGRLERTEAAFGIMEKLSAFFENAIKESPGSAEVQEEMTSAYRHLVGIEERGAGANSRPTKRAPATPFWTRAGDLDGVFENAIKESPDEPGGRKTSAYRHLVEAASSTPQAAALLGLSRTTSLPETCRPGGPRVGGAAEQAVCRGAGRDPGRA